MARPLRIEYPGALYHITSRGNRRAQVYTDDEDRRNFLRILADVNRRFETRCHAYCLMGNHYHLVLETPRGNLSAAMRQLNGVYTQKYNWLHGKVGHVFQGRYKSIIIERDAHLLEAARYVVLNPVRAGIARGPEDWPWSSYLATAGLAEPEPCLDTKWLLGQFGEELPGARKRYVDFVLEAPDIDLEDRIISGMVLGSEEFAAWCRQQALDSGNMSEVPKAQRFAGRPDLATILDGPGRKAWKVFDAVETHGYSQKAVADALGVHYSAVSKLLSRKMSRFKT